jgi:hypothetical protein
LADERYESLEDAREAILVVGEDGVVVFANESARSLLGRSEAQLVGRPFIDPSLGLRTLDDQPLTEEESPVRRVMQSGSSVSAANYIEHHPDGTVAILSLAARPLGLGQAAPAVSVQMAQTARLLVERAASSTVPAEAHWEELARRLQGLAQMSGLLASTVTSEQAFAQIAEYASILFDLPASAVLKEDEDRGLFLVKATCGLDGPIGVNRLSAEEVRRLGLDRPVPVIITELRALGHLDFFARLRDLGYESAICLGLVTELGAHGIVVLLAKVPSVVLEDDLVFLRLFGTMAAAALNTAERHETDLLVARTVQDALLAIPTQVPGVQHAALHRSATEGAVVGGDFYDVFNLPDGRLAILIGDISGKGLDASLLMAVLKNTVKAYSYTHEKPAEILRLCNELLVDSAPEPAFATVFMGLYDPAAGALEYCGAGHPPPFLVRPEGSVERLEPRSPVIGMLEQVEYVDDTIDFSPGDLLFLYTDGVTETRSENDFLGEDRLLEWVSSRRGLSPRDLTAEIFREVGEFADGKLRDDLAILVVKPD